MSLQFVLIFFPLFLISLMYSNLQSILRASYRNHVIWMFLISGLFLSLFGMDLSVQIKILVAYRNGARSMMDRLLLLQSSMENHRQFKNLLFIYLFILPLNSMSMQSYILFSIFLSILDICWKGLPFRFFLSINKELALHALLLLLLLLNPSRFSAHIVIGNLGDCRAVLCRNGQAVPLSDDHKPSRPGLLKFTKFYDSRIS